MISGSLTQIEFRTLKKLTKSKSNTILFSASKVDFCSEDGDVKVEENKKLKKEIGVLEAANDALAEENAILKDLVEGLEAENQDLKDALKSVASQLRSSAEGIDQALERLEGVELN